MSPEMGWALLRVTSQPAAHSSPSRGQATPDNRLVSETPLTASRWAAVLAPEITASEQWLSIFGK